MKRQKLLTKAILMMLPVAFCGSVAFAQSAKKPGRKDVAAVERKNAELQNKVAANSTTGAVTTPVKKSAAATTNANRPCITSVRKNPYEVTQAMLNKMPKDRQEFVKAHPEKFTIVNN